LERFLETRISAVNVEKWIREFRFPYRFHALLILATVLSSVVAAHSGSVPAANKPGSRLVVLREIRLSFAQPCKSGKLD
jgi:hypothetical protein